MSTPFEIQGSAQFYKRLEPLSPTAHGALALRTGASPFRFAHDSHAAPLTVGEFLQTASSYPIIFTPAPHQPMAVMGLEANRNLFIDADGGVATGAYLPAFIRRYPFIFAEDKGSDRLVVCIDRDAEAVAEDGDTPLFEDGKPTAATDQAIAFLQAYEIEKRQTRRLVDLLVELDLLEPRQAVFRKPGQSEGEGELLATFHAVSETALDNLSEEQWEKLRAVGAVSAIYAHVISQANWTRLAAFAEAGAAEVPVAPVLEPEPA